jgi:hypothetical protein
LLDRIGLRNRPQLIDTRKVGAGNVEAPVASAGRDQELRVIENLAAVQLNPSRRAVDARRSGSGDMHVVLVVPIARRDEPAREPLFPAQVGLGQGRSPKRDAWLTADQRQAPFVTLLTQRSGGHATGHPRTDDHKRARRVQRADS